MTLLEATKELEAGFTDVQSDVKQQYDKDLPVVWSGGTRTFEETAWALFADREAAVAKWFEAAKAHSGGKNLRWIVRPELLEFQITIADKLGRHRAVNNRFAVKSQFVTNG